MSSILLALLPFAIFLVEPKATHHVIIQNEKDGSFLNASDCSTTEWSYGKPQLWEIVHSQDHTLVRNKKYKSFLSLINDEIILCYSPSLAKKFSKNDSKWDGIKLIYCFNNDFNYMKDVYLQ